MNPIASTPAFQIGLLKDELDASGPAGVDLCHMPAETVRARAAFSRTIEDWIDMTFVPEARALLQRHCVRNAA
jgi:hypothetical protein